jgi:hypothetical protein
MRSDNVVESGERLSIDLRKIGILLVRCSKTVARIKVGSSLAVTVVTLAYDVRSFPRSMPTIRFRCDYLASRCVSRLSRLNQYAYLIHSFCKERHLQTISSCISAVSPPRQLIRRALLISSNH